MDFKGLSVKQAGTLRWNVGVGKKLGKRAVIRVKKKALPGNFAKISVKFKNKYDKALETQNVIGYIEGATYPDSFFVFTGHYDHLGQLGETFFPGADDNATGIAMMMELAKHYMKEENRPRYSIVFMAFGGEENGLLGASFFAENPLFNLSAVKCLVNFDMLGFGQEKLYAFNAVECDSMFARIKLINDQENYFTLVE